MGEIDREAVKWLARDLRAHLFEHNGEAYLDAADLLESLLAKLEQAERENGRLSEIVAADTKALQQAAEENAVALDKLAAIDVAYDKATRGGAVSLVEGFDILIAQRDSALAELARMREENAWQPMDFMTALEPPVVFSREFAMGNPETFSLPPVACLLDRYLEGRKVVVDPFARNSRRGAVTNDLSPATAANYHMLAEDFVEQIVVEADAVLFDPPYSPRQITECYQSIGRVVTAQDTQNARLYRRVKDGLDKMLKRDGIAICCGWNSMGFGLKRGYQMLEILMVPHGAAHNDTIVTVERKR